MTLRISGLIARGLLGVALAILLSACSKPDGRRILGHWRAEPLQLQGIRVPIGPEFVISRNQLRSPSGEIDIPISSITEDGDTITLDIPLGLGLSFQFEGSDRMSFEVPLVGHKIYYRRVTDATSTINPQPASAPPTRVVPGPPSGTPQHSREVESSVHVPAATLQQDKREHNSTPMTTYNQAILHMRSGDADEAVRSLHDAFEQGFRDFRQLDASQDLAPLKNDPRYQALLTRYR